MRLDEDKLETLRRWGRGLHEAGGGESAAAGRAILLLIEEIERLHVELERVREQPSRGARPSDDEPAETPEEPFASSLQERLQRVLTRDSDSLPATGSRPGEEPGSSTEEGRASTSPQDWIDALRRRT